MHRRFLLAILLLSTTATTAVSSTAPSKLNSIARYTLEKLKSRTALAALEQTPASVTAAGELNVFITGDVSRAELEAAGARVRTALPGIFTASLPLDAVERVAALRNVRTIEGASRAEPELNVSVPSTNAPLSRGAGPSFAGMNGAGVIVGDVDSGIDYGHGDFDDPSGNTRILNIWDQTTGAFWNSTHIDANTATQLDTDGHGTHVMGIMAGDGSQTGQGVPAHTYAGMAPAADIIMVKTTFSTADILDGVDYVFNRATALGKPAVVNLSLGSSFGSHDGTSPFEAGLSAMTGPGRILCKSAGNSGGAAIHAERVVGAGETIATVSVSGSAPGRIFAIDGYYEAGEALTVELRTPGGTTVGPLALGAGTVQGTPNGTVTLENGVFTTATGDRQIAIVAESTTGSLNGTWTITFAPVVLGATNGEVDMWRYFATSGLSASFVMGNQPDEEVISEPGNADSAVTVGSYATKQFWQDCNGFTLNFVGSATPGSFSPFSSAGPTRDHREKPDISAPGSAIGSVRTFDVAMSCAPGGSLLLRDGLNHIINQGTSMASPHAAGAAALLLQKNPNWTPSQVKDYLFANAKLDAATGAVWNPLWGNGKLRLGDLLDPTALVTAPNGGEYLVMGSSSDLTWNASDNQGVTSVDIQLSRNGGATYEDIALGVPNTGTHAWNATGPVTANAMIKVTAHDAAGNLAIDESDAPFEIGTGVDAPIGGAITEFALFLRSSNPTRGPLTIELAVPVQSDLSVALYDLQGRMVTTLAQGSHAAGRHEIRWDARSNRAEPGIYFVRFKAPGRELVKRLIVIH